MATISLELVPFDVPTGVHIQRAPGRRQDGFQPSKPLQLSEVPLETLEQLCADFRKSVLEAAGHSTARGMLNPYPDEVEPGSQEALNRR